METRDAILQRRSIRRFLSKPVPEEIIREIISDALWAPSWGNTQPWEIIVATGNTLRQFKKENQEALMSGKQPNPEVPIPQEWPEAHKGRYKGIGKSVLESLEIKRDDVDGRSQWANNMYSFFDAPALVMITLEKELALEFAMLDVGLIMQTLCLLAHNKGLGTCIMAVSIYYPDIARRLLDIPDNKRIIIGTALGWPDLSSAINQFDRQRGELSEFFSLKI